MCSIKYFLLKKYVQGLIKGGDDDTCGIDVSVFFIKEVGWVRVSLYLGLVTYYVMHGQVQKGNTQAF